MATFPGSKVHRVSRRQLGRGQSTKTQGGALGAQGVTFTDLGFSYNQGVPSQSIFNAPTVLSGLIVVAALFDNTHTPVLTITDSVGAHTPGPDNGPVSVDGSFVTCLYSQFVQAGRINIALAVGAMQTADMAFRVGIITGLSANSLVGAAGAASSGTPVSGVVNGMGPGQLFFGCVGGKNGQANPTFQDGFFNVGNPLSFQSGGATYILQAAYQRALQASALNLQSPNFYADWAANLAAYS